MKKRIFSVLAIMCSMMLILTGCGEANETDVSDGGINAQDNTMNFSELFKKDVIAYFGTLKDDDSVKVTRCRIKKLITRYEICLLRKYTIYVMEKKQKKSF